MPTQKRNPSPTNGLPCNENTALDNHPLNTLPSKESPSLTLGRSPDAPDLPFCEEQRLDGNVSRETPDVGTPTYEWAYLGDSWQLHDGTWTFRVMQVDTPTFVCLMPYLLLGSPQGDTPPPISRPAPPRGGMPPVTDGKDERSR